jgi:hypothetical protein
MSDMDTDDLTLYAMLFHSRKIKAVIAFEKRRWMIYGNMPMTDPFPPIIPYRLRAIYISRKRAKYTTTWVHDLRIWNRHIVTVKED